MDLVQWLPLVGGLGVGSVVGNYVGAGRARREVRSAVLKSVEALEMERWAPVDYRAYRTAYRDLESAALVARVPRRAMRHYLVLAEAAEHMSANSWLNQDGEEQMGAGGIDGYFSDVVTDSAELVIQLSWRPWLTRAVLSSRLRRLRVVAQKLGDDDGEIMRAIIRGQQVHGRLPGPLGELPGIRLQPPFVQTKLNELPETY